LSRAQRVLRASTSACAGRSSTGGAGAPGVRL